MKHAIIRGFLAGILFVSFGYVTNILVWVEAGEPLTERFVCYLTAAVSNEINDYAKENKISKIRVARQALIDYLKILKSE